MEKMIADLPAWLLSLVRGAGDRHAEESADEPVIEGRRNDFLFRSACSMRRRGFGSGAIEAALIAENTARCTPPLSESEVRRIAASAATYRPEGAAQERGAYGSPTSSPSRVELVSADALARMTFEDRPSPVPGLLAEGLNLLASRPKMGKSFLFLGAGADVAASGRVFGVFDSVCSDVLYFGLEDNLRRLQRRLKTMFPGGPPSRLHVATQLARLDQGGLVQLETVLDDHPDCRLLGLDTLARIRPRRKKNADIYEEDSAFGATLQELALRRHLALVLIHHLRKPTAGSDDVLDEVLGSTGLTGIADNILVLKRQRGQADATLTITGRDIEERVIALRFDSESCLWQYIGEGAEVAISRERAEILEVLRKAGPLRPKEVADRLGKAATAVKALLWKMLGDGQAAEGPLRGTYVLPSEYPNPVRRDSHPVDIVDPVYSGDSVDSVDPVDRDESLGKRGQRNNGNSVVCAFFVGTSVAGPCERCGLSHREHWR